MVMLFLSQGKDVWNKGFKDLQHPYKTPQSMLLNAELKHLYTVITRAKVNLWIYESEPVDEHLLPILTEWKESSMPLIDVVDPNDPSFKFDISFVTAKKSTPKQWKLQGDTLRKQEKWKQASLCYRKAHRFDLEAETEAMALESEEESTHTRSQYYEIAVAYLKADEILDNATHLVKVAKNLFHAARNPDEYLRAAWLYKALRMVRLISLLLITVSY